MLPSRMAGGMAQSSSSSGIFFEGDGQSQVDGYSQLNSTIRNSSNSLSGHGYPSVSSLSGNVNSTMLNSVPSSSPSIGASSLVTDANSGLSPGPHLQRSASSINTESYTRLPASPMSFSSNNISMDGSNQDPGSQRSLLNQQHLGASSSTPFSTSHMGQVQLYGGQRAPNSFIQDPISQLQKKPRLDMKQENVLQQHVMQLLQRQDSMYSQSPNPQLLALIQQQRLRQQQQQLLQSMTPMQRVQFLKQQQQQQQQQLRQQLPQPGSQPQPTSGTKRPHDAGVCSRRLMQYLYHQRQRPADNAIAYWRKFVSEYYSPRAKKKWCLSQYENVGQYSLGVFPQAAMDAWKCDLCGSKSGRGFEATFEVLPRLHEINFGSGVIDELLFLDLPRERRYPSGIMTLDYAKAVQETVYEQLRVVREGQLRIIFTPDLKILAWEFCARRHEELLPRRLVAPQVNQLLQVAQKCQSTIAESGSDGVSQQDIQANSALVVTAGRQLARSLELQSLHDLGFSKAYVRCLQIAEHVNVMKDLMDYCDNQKLGAVEGLKKFPRRATMPKIETQSIQENRILGGGQGLPTDRGTLNKLMSLRSSSPANNTEHMTGRGAFNGLGLASSSNYQNSLTRENSINPTYHSHNSMKQEPSSPLITPNQPPTTPRNFQNSNGLLQQIQSQPSIGNQVLQQQQMIQQLLSNNKKDGTVPHQSVSVKNPVDNGVGFRSSFGTTDDGNGPRNVEGLQNGSDSSKAASNGESTVTDCDNGQKGQDLTQNLHVSDEMFQDFMEFSKNGFFDNNNLDDEMKNFSWPDE